MKLEKYFNEGIGEIYKKNWGKLNKFFHDLEAFMTLPISVIGAILATVSIIAGFFAWAIIGYLFLLTGLIHTIIVLFGGGVGHFWAKDLMFTLDNFFKNRERNNFVKTSNIKKIGETIENLVLNSEN